MNSGIYKITNTVNGKFYIGSSRNLQRRKSTHFTELDKNTHINKRLQNAYNKYGKENFKFEIIEYVENVGNLIKTEQAYIDKYKPYEKTIGYNILSNAWGGTLPGIDSPRYGKKISERHKTQISNANKGRKHTEEEKNKISVAKTGKTHKGIVHTDKTKEKIRQKAIGRKLPNIPRTDDWVKHMSESRIGKRVGKENHNHKVVVQLTGDMIFVNVFDALADASRKTNSNINSICACCNGRRNYAGGYRWMHLDKYVAEYGGPNGDIRVT